MDKKLLKTLVPQFCWTPVIFLLSWAVIAKGVVTLIVVLALVVLYGST